MSKLYCTLRTSVRSGQRELEGRVRTQMRSMNGKP